MFDASVSWQRQVVLLTLLCGVILYWVPQEGRPLWEMLKWDDQTTFPFFLAITLSLFLPAWKSRCQESLLRWIGNHALAVASMATVCLGILSPWVYQARPLSTDEYLLWFQAHVFADLKLYAQYPRDWLPHIFGTQELFISDWRDGRLLSPYWPGFSLVLAPFAALDIPWLGNPVIVGLSIVVISRLAKEIFGGTEAAGFAVVLSVASSAFFFNGVTFYAMPAHLLLNSVFTLLLLKPDSKRIYLACAVGSLALVLHNPLPHILYAMPWLLWIVWSRENRLRTLMLVAAGYLPISILIGIGWAFLRLQSGCSPACAAAEAGLAAPKLSALGSFATSAFVMPTGAILEWRIAAFVKLWLASVPGLVLLAFIGASRHRTTHTKLLAASGFLTFIGYLFVPFDQGFGWGYRYFHAAWFVLPLLATAAVFGRGQGVKDSSEISVPLVLRAAVLSLLLLAPAKGFVMYRYTTDLWNQLPPHHHRDDEILFKNSVGHWALFVIQNPPRMDRTPTVFLSRGRRLDREFVDKNFPGAMLADVNTYGTTYRLSENQSAKRRLEELNRPRPGRHSEALN